MQQRVAASFTENWSNQFLDNYKHHRTYTLIQITILSDPHVYVHNKCTSCAVKRKKVTMLRSVSPHCIFSIIHNDREHIELFTIPHTILKYWSALRMCVNLWISFQWIWIFIAVFLSAYYGKMKGNWDDHRLWSVSVQFIDLLSFLYICELMHCGLNKNQFRVFFWVGLRMCGSARILCLIRFWVSSSFSIEKYKKRTVEVLNVCSKRNVC